MEASFDLLCDDILDTAKVDLFSSVIRSLLKRLIVKSEIDLVYFYARCFPLRFARFCLTNVSSKRSRCKFQEPKVKHIYNFCQFVIVVFTDLQREARICQKLRHPHIGMDIKYP